MMIRLSGMALASLALVQIGNDAYAWSTQCIAFAPREMAACFTLGAAIWIAPLPSLAADIDRGAQLFANNCASCHADGGNVIKEQRTLQKGALEKYVGLDQPTVQKFAQESMRHKMLVFPNVPGGKLTNDDWADVTTYVVDQAMGDKW